MSTVLESSFPEYTVEIQRSYRGHKEEETAAFYTREEAEQWADTMRLHYGWPKAWINGIEYKTVKKGAR